MKVFTLSKPPPSVNAMWRAVNMKGKVRNILSKDGRAWQKFANDELSRQPKGIENLCYWGADILIPSEKTKCDLDNLLKGILDALGAAKKTPDDRYLVDLRIRFHGGDTVIITIHEKDLSKWAKIKKASKSLIRKLEKSGSQQLNL